MIIFENKGELDIRAIKTFGVNSKSDKGSAIGYFGTGLKYAIAILLREEHKVSIKTNGVTYNFGVQNSKIRNDVFDIVTMNGEELGFTTQLGRDWKLWQAFRELYSNMLDEGGSAYELPIFTNPDKESTYVIVDGAGMTECFHDRDRYFMSPNRGKALHSDGDVSLYARVGTRTAGDVYYKNVRVMGTRAPALFDYNHHRGLTLTEDRTIVDTWSTLYHVARLVMQSQDKRFIKQMVMCNSMMYEAGISYRKMFGTNIDTFLDVVGELRKRYKDVGINASAITLHKELRNTQHFLPSVSCHLNSVETQQLERAISFCKDTLELDIDDYRLIIAKDLGSDGHLGRANIEDGIMYISKQCFREGTKRVATALLEEYTHCKYEVIDETVEQKWVYLNQILSLGERLLGEPL